MYDAMNYIAKTGLSYEQDYPYVSGGTGNNPPVPCESGLKTAIKVQASYEAGTATGTATATELEEAIHSYGSVAVLVDASGTGWQDYASGVLPATACGTAIDHAVVAVGYTSAYWIVRNRLHEL